MAADTGAVARAALELGSATLGESGARRMHPRIKPVWKGARIAAPAFPVRCTPGDNLALHVAVARAPEGSALVADMGGVRDFGYWGEVLTTGAEARGLTALVIDACVRDCNALEAHGFPVFATGLALTGAGKSLAGSLREPITVGDVDVELADWVVGDTDGVVVIPGGELDAVLAAGRARADKEAGLFDALRAGATTLDLLDLDPGPVQG
ncbi:MAG: 4-hydroxy-4-methyl-2-oxoglutarate aldolase [Actinomycetota bacterium]|nr:4-hydroxy-4-methyl-2-oxoglutarate aldolase [Actinomycetota bacterium]